MGKQAKEANEQSCEEREQLTEQLKQEKQARLSERERAWVDKTRHEVRKVTHCLSTANIPNCCAFCQCVKCTKRDASAGGEHVRQEQNMCTHKHTTHTHRRP